VLQLPWLLTAAAAATTWSCCGALPLAVKLFLDTQQRRQQQQRITRASCRCGNGLGLLWRAGWGGWWSLRQDWFQVLQGQGGLGLLGRYGQKPCELL
jgi:hypothetical protein